MCVPYEDSNHLGESPSLALPFPKWRTLECVAPSRRTLQVITAFNGIHAHTHSLIHTHSHVFFLPRVLNWAERTRKLSESVICYVIRMVMAALFADLEISQNNTVNSAVTQTTCKTIAQALGRSSVSPNATNHSKSVFMTCKQFHFEQFLSRHERLLDNTPLSVLELFFLLFVFAI